jgi:hypothetical protein
MCVFREYVCVHIEWLAPRAWVKGRVYSHGRLLLATRPAGKRMDAAARYSLHSRWCVGAILCVWYGCEMFRLAALPVSANGGSRFCAELEAEDTCVHIKHAWHVADLDRSVTRSAVFSPQRVAPLHPSLSRRQPRSRAALRLLRARKECRVHASVRLSLGEGRAPRIGSQPQDGAQAWFLSSSCHTRGVARTFTLD